MHFMEDIGDYFYLILLVVFSLAGLLKKKKISKPLSETSESDEEYEPEDVVVFPTREETTKPRTISEEAPATVNWPVYSKQEINKTKTIFDGVADSYETASDFTKIKAHKQVKPVRVEVKRPTYNIDEISDTQNSEFVIESPEDARRAIIFSEIIHRKY